MPQTMKAQGGANEIGDLVRVRFLDSAEFDTRYDDQECPATCEAVGWVMESEKGILRIAWLIDDCPDKCHSGLTVPEGCIVEVSKLSSSERGE